MQDTTLSGATLQETAFTGSFDPPWSVATCSNGHYWAMGSRRGGVRVWRDDGKTLELAWHHKAVEPGERNPVCCFRARGAKGTGRRAWEALTLLALAGTAYRQHPSSRLTP